MNWLELNDPDQLEVIKSLSNNPEITGVLIFKHSTRCATSAMALNRMERGWNVNEHQVPTYFLDLLNHRDISNSIASLFEVAHESPQVMVIKNGGCIYQSSHNAISASEITDSLGIDNN